MAKFQRKDLRDIIGESCTEEIENRIMALHLGVVDQMKDDIAKYKAEAEKLPGVQKELDDMKAEQKNGYKEKYNAEHKAFEEYKAGIAAKEAKTAKDAAVRKYISEHDFDGKKISGDNLDIAMMAIAGLIDGVELEGEKLKKTEAIDSVMTSKLARLASADKTVGIPPATPPGNNGTGTKPISRAAQLEAQYHANLYGEAKKE